MDQHLDASAPRRASIREAIFKEPTVENTCRQLHTLDSTAYAGQESCAENDSADTVQTCCARQHHFGKLSAVPGGSLVCCRLMQGSAA